MKKHWYTNDIEEAMFIAGQEPNGWHRGRAKAVREQISKTETGKTVDQEVRVRIADKHRGKPSPTKGRHHTEEAKKKIGNASRNRTLSEETRKKISAAHKGKKLSKEQKELLSVAHKGQIPWNKGLVGFKQSNETKQKRSKALTGHKHSAETKEKMSIIAATKEHQDKINRTKKLNHSFNSSRPEEDFYKVLLTIFNVNDIKRQYSDKRYPFNCDFYICSLDIFIELNFSWTHGGHKYSKRSKKDQLKVAEWREKAKKSKYYAKAIETWLCRDWEKFYIAKMNNLNYLVAYNDNESQIIIEYLKNMVSNTV